MIKSRRITLDIFERQILPEIWPDKIMNIDTYSPIPFDMNFQTVLMLKLILAKLLSEKGGPLDPFLTFRIKVCFSFDSRFSQTLESLI